MTATRWTLLLLAALAGIAGLIHATREPAGSTPAVAHEPAVAALPLNLPATAASEAPAGATPQPAASPRAASPVASAAPRIGSEGYGAHIERAREGTPAAAWEAVQWLRECASNTERRQSMELVRGERIPQEMLTQLMLEADAEARRCQTVTAQHQAMLQELALRAIRGSVPDAAGGFAALVKPGDLAPALRQEVADALRRDADAGQAGGLLGAMMHGTAWGLSDDERLGYLVAFSEMGGNSGPTLVRQWIEQRTVSFKAAPNAEQLSAAQIAGRRIAARSRAGNPP